MPAGTCLPCRLLCGTVRGWLEDHDREGAHTRKHEPVVRRHEIRLGIARRRNGGPDTLEIGPAVCHAEHLELLGDEEIIARLARATIETISLHPESCAAKTEDNPRRRQNSQTRIARHGDVQSSDTVGAEAEVLVVDSTISKLLRCRAPNGGGGREETCDQHRRSRHSVDDCALRRLQGRKSNELEQDGL